MALRIRKALVVLGYAFVLLFAMRMAEVQMRPQIRGMADDACQHVADPDKGEKSIFWRWLVGGRPEFDDWTRTCKFAAKNAALVKSGRKVDVVFIGDSITQHWEAFKPELFAGSFVNRGITSQSSAQILSRFQSDVVALKPRAVHLLSGTNDVTGLAGPSTPEAWHDTMIAMIDLARANGIVVIVGTMPPMMNNPLDPAHKPAGVILRENAWLAQLAKEKGLILADYHAVLANREGGFRPGLADDEIHPSPQGYGAMRPVLDKALAEAGVK